MSNNEFFDSYDLEIVGESDSNNNNVINVDDSIPNIFGSLESSSTDNFISNNKLKSSTVWTYFDIGSSGNPICKKCNNKFSANSSVTTLRRHLTSHTITAPPKKRQRTIDEFRNDPHSINDQLR